MGSPAIFGDHAAEVGGEECAAGRNKALDRRRLDFADHVQQRRDYQMRLEVTGELPTPNILITSTPALEAADVLLMVMTGQVPASTSDTASSATGSSGQRFALLGAYLSRGLFQDLGFSGEDRLEISAGEHISRSGRETYEFEYKLGKRWSLTGEYDEFDAYNAGLKWRVYTEEGTPLAKKK